MEKESFFAKCLSQSSNLCLPRGWSLIARERGEDLFIQQLNDWIEEKQIPCPQTSVTLEEACADFAKLCERDGAWKVDLWYHGLEDEARYGMLIPQTRVGNSCSRFFNTSARIKTPGQGGPSVAQLWQDPVKRKRALRILKFKSRYDVSISSDALLTLLGTQACNASFFRPSAAKAVYRVFDAKHVYDFSAGWGDRLIGALATPGLKTYWATDPNVSNQELYSTICKSLKRPEEWDPLLVCIEPYPAEEYVPPGGRRFDLVFTSCPYFHTERYAEGTPHESLQSWYRYKTVEAWVDGFALPAIKNAVSVLVPGGALAINIANCKQNGKVLPLVQLLKERVSAIPELTFKGEIGYRLSARYGAKRLSKSLNNHCEPILIWQTS